MVNQRAIRLRLVRPFPSPWFAFEEMARPPGSEPAVIRHPSSVIRHPLPVPRARFQLFSFQFSAFRVCLFALYDSLQYLKCLSKLTHENITRLP